MLSHVALMMNPNLDEKGLRECLEMSFESKHRQLDSIQEMERKMEEGDKEIEKLEQDMMRDAVEWNEKHPEHWMPLPRFKSKTERQMERESIAMQMHLMVLLY